MEMVGVATGSRIQADSRPKSTGLVWGLAAIRHRTTFIRWTEWTLAMTLSHDDSTINIVLIIIIIIIIIICFGAYYVKPAEANPDTVTNVAQRIEFLMLYSLWWHSGDLPCTNALNRGTPWWNVFTFGLEISVTPLEMCSQWWAMTYVVVVDVLPMSFWRVKAALWLCIFTRVLCCCTLCEWMLEAVCFKYECVITGGFNLWRVLATAKMRMLVDVDTHTLTLILT